MTKKGILAGTGYIGIMAAAMIVLTHVFKLNYEEPEMVKVLIYFEIILTLYSVYIYRRFFKGTAFRKMKITPEMVIFTICIGAAFFMYLAPGSFSENRFMILLTAATTLLVGISEELMFRGVVLSGFLEKHGKMQSVLYSALLFSLLHSVNMLGGLSSEKVCIQLLMTFVYGILTGCFRIKTGNIFPFMIFHFVWDLMTVSKPLADPDIDLFIMMLFIVETVMAFTMSRDIAKMDREKKTE